VKKVLGILLFSVCLAGCGGGGSASSSSSMTGNWQFTATSTPFGVVTTGTGSLQQNKYNSSFSGQLSLTGTPCATSASLSGYVGGVVNGEQTLIFQIQEGSQELSFNGTTNVTFSSAAGTYTAPSGGCTNGDFGTWSATKTS
jgi:hypothetical protein